jgi:hypothetical protein
MVGVEDTGLLVSVRHRPTPNPSPEGEGLSKYHTDAAGKARVVGRGATPPAGMNQ